MTGQSRFLLRDERDDRTTDNAYFAPDGQRLFGCYQDGIQVWDAQTGRPIAFWELAPEKAGWPTSVHLSPDSSTLVVQASTWHEEDDEIEHGTNFVQLWNAHTGEQIQDFLIDQATRCAFSADSKQLALVRCSDSQSGRIELWTVEGELKSQSPELPAGFQVYRLAFQPDGNVLCEGAYDSRMTTLISTPSSSWSVGPVSRQQAFLWDIHTNQLTERLSEEEETLSPDRKWKAIAYFGSSKTSPVGAIQHADTGEKLCDLEALATG